MNNINFFKGSNNIKIIFIMSLLMCVGILIIITKFSNKTDLNECIVSFESNGGGVVEPRNIECGTTLDEQIITNKDGFLFEGWYYNGKLFNFSTKIEKSILLTAKYKKIESNETIIVTFEMVGGSGIKEIEILKGSKINLPLNPIKSGYEFKGWYYNDKLFNESMILTEDITLIAKWEKLKVSESVDKQVDTYNNTSSSKKEEPETNDKNGLIDKEENLNNSNSPTKKEEPETNDKNGSTDKEEDSNNSNSPTKKEEPEVNDKNELIDKEENSNNSNSSTIIKNQIDVSITSLNLEVGENIKFSANYAPIDISQYAVSCMSLDSNIGYVEFEFISPGSISGIFYAKNPGSTKIECSNFNGGLANEVKNYIDVNVYKNDVKGFKFTKSTERRAYYEGVGGFIPSFYEFSPTNATNQDITLSSSNESVAIISNGAVVPVGIGVTIITAKTLEGGFTDSFELETYEIKLEKIEIKKCTTLNQYLKVGETHQLGYSLNPSYTTYKNIRWFAENSLVQNTPLHGKSVLSVDQNGLVTALVPGYAYVYVQDTITGFKDRCNFIVEN